MKKMVVLIFCAGFFSLAHAQALIGKWQETTPEISAGYLNTYEFSSDSTFLFSTNENFGLKRIVSIGGRYKYDKVTNILTFVVEFTNETLGGTIERRKESGGASDSWEISGGQTRKIRLPKPVKETIVVEFQKSDKPDTELILLDKRKYYKVE